MSVEITPDDMRGAALSGHLTLILAGLAPGRSVVSAAPAATGRALTGLGARIVPDASGFSVDGVGNGCLVQTQTPLAFGADLDAAMLVTGLVATYDMPTRIVCAGDPGALLAALAAHGVQIAPQADGWTVDGPPMANPAGHHAKQWSDAQVVAVVLAALNAPGRTTLDHVTDAAALMAPFTRFAAGVTATENAITVEGQAPLVPLGDALP